MYESFFGFERSPFAAAPDPGCCINTRPMQQALDPLRRCVEAGQGIGILTAPPGMGKTLLLSRMLADLERSFAVLFLANSNFPTRRSLLQAMVYELGQPYLRMGEQELRLELTSALRALRPQKRGLVMAVDEAHLLAEYVLEEIRGVTNLVDDGEPLVRVVLGGQLLLEERLANPKLDALNQRIGCQTTIEPLTRKESGEYLAERLRCSGVDPGKIFTPEAIQAICHASDGVPRCINQLCDRSLAVASAAGIQPVDRAMVLEALEALKQLPLHWNDLPASMTRDVEADAPARQQVWEQREEAEQVDSLADDDSLLTDGEAEMTAIEVGADIPQIESPTFDNSPPAETGDVDCGVIEVGADCVPTTEQAAVASHADDGNKDSCIEIPSDATAATAKQADLVKPSEVLIDYWRPQGDGWILVEDLVPASETQAVESSAAVPPMASADAIIGGQMETPAPNERESEKAAADGSKNATTPKPQPERVTESVGFEEEPVVDHYAMLDAGNLPGGPDYSYMSFIGQLPPVEDELRPSPDEVIDAVAPMIDEALSDGWGDPDIAGGNLPQTVAADAIEDDGTSEDAATPATPVVGHTDDRAGSDGVSRDSVFRGTPAAADEETYNLEEAIGATVFDTCLDTQQAIDERLREIDRAASDEEAASDRDEPLEFPESDTDDVWTASTQYDVVQPDVDTPSRDDSLRRPLDGASVEDAGSAPQRPYGQLFSELRRRGK